MTQDKLEPLKSCPFHKEEIYPETPKSLNGKNIYAICPECRTCLTIKQWNTRVQPKAVSDWEEEFDVEFGEPIYPNATNKEPFILAETKDVKSFIRNLLTVSPKVGGDVDKIHTVLCDNRICQDDNGIVKMPFKEYNQYLWDIAKAIAEGGIG